jgi:hypothetical protein
MLLALGVITVIIGGAAFLPSGHLYEERDKVLGCLLMLGSVVVIGAGFAMMVAYAIQQIG